jgi:hypothetical protein
MTTDDAAFERARWIARGAVALSLVAGLLALGQAVAAWPELPPRVPVHFGASGAPDAWAEKSLAAIFVLPLMALLMGPGIGLLALAAVGSHRPPPDRTELRAAMPPLAIFLGLIAALTSALLSGLSMGAIDVARGRADTLGWWPLAGGGLLGACAIVGAIYFLVRHSPIGGSKGAAGDPARWRWGLFYVASDDPSLFVEKRWGGGYTINFGIPAGRRIGWGMIAFALGMLAIVAWLVAAS